MSNHTHETVKCSCGVVLIQCRCFAPKVERIIQNGCNDCSKRAGLPPMAYVGRPGDLFYMPPPHWGPSITISREWLLRKKDFYLTQATLEHGKGAESADALLVKEWIGRARAIDELLTLIGG